MRSRMMHRTIEGCSRTSDVDTKANGIGRECPDGWLDEKEGLLNVV